MIIKSYLKSYSSLHWLPHHHYKDWLHDRRHHQSLVCRSSSLLHYRTKEPLSQPYILFFFHIGKKLVHFIITFAPPYLTTCNQLLTGDATSTVFKLILARYVKAFNDIRMKSTSAVMDSPNIQRTLDGETNAGPLESHSRHHATYV